LFHVGAESITWPCSASWSGTARPGRRCSSRRSRSAGLTSRWARLSSRGGP